MNRPDSQEQFSEKQVVVTGLGAVSAWGWGVEKLWQGLGSGRTGISAARRFDTRGHRTEIVGEVPDPAVDAPAFSDFRCGSLADRYAMAAAAEAARAAGLDPFADPEPDPGLGVFFGGSTAGMAECEELLRRLAKRTGRARWNLLAFHQLNCPGDAVARFVKACGPVQSISSACASGGLALGAALEALRSGEVDAALAGGADSLCQLTYAGFNSLRAVDADPCRPFREERAGMSLGEGAGILYLETRERARRRGVRPLARLLGAGASCDAHHMTAPHPRGEGAALAMRRALDDAGLSPDDVDFVNAHGTGTPHNDVAEKEALLDVFGERAAHLPVTSTKASVGHLLGSSGAIEALVTVRCLAEGEVHPMPSGGEPLEGLDLVIGAPRRLPARKGAGGRVALSTSFGFGGANAAVVLGEWVS